MTQPNWFERNKTWAGMISAVLFLGLLAGLFVFRTEAAVQFDTLRAKDAEQDARLDRMEDLDKKVERILRAVEK